MNVPGMICFTLVVSLLLAQTEGRAFNDAQSREKRQTSSCDGGTRYDTFGVISTNTGDQYSNNENCCWEFTPDVQGTTWTITFNFDTFDLESSSTCSYDALTFYTENGPEKECGRKTNFSSTFSATDNFFQVCFTSDGSVTREGASGSYSIYADNIDPTTTSSLTTDYPDYATTPYPYYVPTDYPQFTTGYPDYYQYPDYVTTPYPYYVPTDYPQFTTSYPDYYQYPDYVTNPYPYYVPTDYPQFTTSYPDYYQYPDYVTTLYPYYVPIDYPQLTTGYPDYYPYPVSCSGNTTYYGNHGSISINDDGSYNNNQDACFSLHPSFTGSGIITFVMNVFDIEEATDCIFDYIEFDDGNTRLRECGTVAEGTQREFEFHDGRFNVCFHSDGSVTKRGFQATYAMNPVQEVDSDVITPFPVDIFNTTDLYNITENTTLPEYASVFWTVNTTMNATDDTGDDCNRDIDDLEGSYTLATDSEGQYENNQRCDITIRSPPTPHITTVNFTRFDLEDDSGCDYDSLTITSDEGTEKLCGPKESFVRQYTGQSVDMTFSSDGSVVRSGFSFDYVTEIVYCNATINAPSGTFESLPGGYENNMYCTYTINTPGPGELVFSFPSFDVETASSCRYDAVVMEGDRLCGTNVEGRTYSTDGHFQFVFTSDGSVTGEGFRINFNFTQTNVTTSPPATLPVSLPRLTQRTPTGVTNSVSRLLMTETCNQVLTSENGILTSPGNGSYANNERCVTVITGPSLPYILVVNFTTFDLESSTNCRYDYLEVDMGRGNSQKGCGSTWSDTTVEYTSDGGNTTVTFSSDSSRTGLGYNATYTLQPRGVPSLSNGECSYINTNISEGVIQSLPGTGSNYPNNMDCSYVFTRNTPFYLNINFTALDTESSSNCRYDYVQVGDDKYCGSDLPNATRLSVQGGSAIIRFRSDGSVTGRGFVALFSIEEHCNFDSDDLEGTYTLPTDSEGRYKNNEHCDISLRFPPSAHITTVNFTRFDLEDEPDCHYDSLTVTSGDTLEQLCGTRESFTREYNGQSVNMTFTSDGTVVRSGFSFNYVTQLVYCNATVNGTSGTFESQPGDYDNNMNCTYTINTPGPGELVFNFPLFDVESGRDCQYDALEIGGERLCGTNIGERIYSTDGHFQFIFTSDGSVTRDGFKTEYVFLPEDIQY
ncbi:dorsal-ventral patterning tolloid-like protein 1 [Haliotis asinina]|uniref:dorsal-ventral patterning tolloid-like protein 1 n=1 Tax=Haliotis asinina TaxID=109174 RepID=UPI003532013C